MKNQHRHCQSLACPPTQSAYTRFTVTISHCDSSSTQFAKNSKLSKFEFRWFELRNFGRWFFHGSLHAQNIRANLHKTPKSAPIFARTLKIRQQLTKNSRTKKSNLRCFCEYSLFLTANFLSIVNRFLRCARISTQRFDVYQYSRASFSHSRQSFKIRLSKFCDSNRDSNLSNIAYCVDDCRRYQLSWPVPTYCQHRDVVAWRVLVRWQQYHQARYEL